jgi:type II secretory pathway pseudopilin PulG
MEMTQNRVTYEGRVRRAAARGDAGFGLVGVIVALILLSVGVLSVSNVLTQSIAMQTIQGQRTTALSIAQVVMEEIRAIDPLTVTAVALQTVDERGVPDVNGLFTLEVTLGDPGRNLISVTVVVSPPRSSQIRLVTWIYDGAF